MINNTGSDALIIVERPTFVMAALKIVKITKNVLYETLGNSLWKY